MYKPVERESEYYPKLSKLKKNPGLEPQVSHDRYAAGIWNIQKCRTSFSYIKRFIIIIIPLKACEKA